jgi:hypothetical protein
MKRKLAPMFWAEAVLAGFTGFLVVLTAVWHDWIEGIFGFDPDHHNGMFEWELVAICLILTVLCAWLARREWRKAASGTAAGATIS